MFLYFIYCLFFLKCDWVFVGHLRRTSDSICMYSDSAHYASTRSGKHKLWYDLTSRVSDPLLLYIKKLKFWGYSIQIIFLCWVIVKRWNLNGIIKAFIRQIEHVLNFFFLNSLLGILFFVMIYWQKHPKSDCINLLLKNLSNLKTFKALNTTSLVIWTNFCAFYVTFNIKHDKLKVLTWMLKFLVNMQSASKVIFRRSG